MLSDSVGLSLIQVQYNISPLFQNVYWLSVGWTNRRVWECGLKARMARAENWAHLDQDSALHRGSCSEHGVVSNSSLFLKNFPQGHWLCTLLKSQYYFQCLKLTASSLSRPNST